MRKIVAIFFLFTLLSTFMHFGELLKLPVLVQHYMEHQHEDNSIDFFRFFAIHYLSGDVKDSDYNIDMKLPFKTLDCNACSTIPFEPTPVFTSSVPADVPQAKPKKSRYIHPHVNPAPNSIFQPPKAC